VSGKALRLARIFDADGRMLIVPVDHGVTIGPLGRLSDLPGLVSTISGGRPDALLCHRGVVQAGLLSPRTAVVLHLSAGTTLCGSSHAKALVCRLEDAVRLGADAVSVHVSLGSACDTEALKQLGKVSSACLAWGMPLLAMMYCQDRSPQDGPASVAHSARIAAELGADIVKVPFTGDAESFRAVVESCFVPVIVAGGAHIGDPQLEAVRLALDVGAAGACIGRGVFQAEDAPGALVSLRNLVHGG
jgi:class I fructose-bisphosphate aldolase